MSGRLDRARVLWMGLLFLSCATCAGAGREARAQASPALAADAGSTAPDPLQTELDLLEKGSRAEREAAANRLAEYPPPATRGALEARLAREEDPTVREAIQRSLSKAEP